MYLTSNFLNNFQIRSNLIILITIIPPKSLSAIESQSQSFKFLNFGNISYVTMHIRLCVTLPCLLIFSRVKKEYGKSMDT